MSCSDRTSLITYDDDVCLGGGAHISASLYYIFYKIPCSELEVVFVTFASLVCGAVDVLSVQRL